MRALTSLLRFVGAGGGVGRINKLSCSHNSSCLTCGIGNWVSGIHRFDKVPMKRPIPWVTQTTEQLEPALLFYVISFPAKPGHFLILLYLNTDICPLGMCTPPPIWNEMVMHRLNSIHHNTHFIVIIFILLRVWQTVSILLLFTHEGGAPKNTGEYNKTICSDLTCSH